MAPSRSWGQSGESSIKLLTTETDYGKRHNIMEGEDFVFSPDRKRLAYWANVLKKPNDRSSHGKVVAVVNGVPGKPYDYVYYDNPRAGNNPPGPIIFSPDSRHVAYRGLRGTSWMVVRDGKEDKAFIQKIKQGVWEYYQNNGTDIIDDIVWSPDSRHLAYRAFRNRKWRVVRDGREGKPYDWIADDDLHFSRDSKGLAFWSKRGRQNLLVLMQGVRVTETRFTPRPIPNPKEDPPPNDVPEDPNLPWQEVKRGDYQVVVWNGREGKPYDEIFSPVLSRGGRHLAYWARKADKWHIVVDGIEVEGKSYQNGASAEPGYWSSEYTPDYVPPGHNLDPLIFDGPESLHTMALRFDGHIVWVQTKIVNE